MDAAIPQNRLDRRKARTRAAIIAAARRLLTERDANEVSIQEITDAADVGFGSFYNHFESKAQLFEEAIGEVIEQHGAMLDTLTATVVDPAEVMAISVRITARFPKMAPEFARIIDRAGASYLGAPDGLAPRAVRDMERGAKAGRFVLGDPTVAVACVGGALLGVIHLSLTLPKASAVDRAADELAVNVLMMLGLTNGDARDVVGRRLPRIDWPLGYTSAHP